MNFNYDLTAAHARLNDLRKQAAHARLVRQAKAVIALALAEPRIFRTTAAGNPLSRATAARTAPI